MERAVIAIVARHLKEAQNEHAKALRIAERIQRVLNRKQIQAAEAGNRLIRIEEIHNAVTRD